MASKAILVGNSDGIGLAVTRRLLAAGWAVAGISRSPSPIDDPSYKHHVCDVTAPEYPAQIARLAETMRPDVCIYCAGIGDKIDFANLAADVVVFDVNLMGMVKTAAAVLPGMIERKAGHFIGLSSLADELNSGYSPSYSGSKAGFTRYLLSLDRAVRRRGVAVTNVRFGFVRTKMGKGATRPFEMTVEKAADHIEKCLRRRPSNYSAPAIMLPLVKLTRVMLFFKSLRR